jgi:hypothetical protein
MKKFVLLLTLLSPFSMADINFSGHVKAGLLTINDPDGEADQSVVAIPGLKTTLDLSSRYTYLIAGFEYLTASVDGSVENIGQDVDGYSLFVGAERRFSLSRSTKLWLSGALTYNDLRFENRYTIDEDGFLDMSFDDRKESIAGISLASDVYFDVATSWRWGLGIFADVPFGDGVQVAGVKLTFGSQLGR